LAMSNAEKFVGFTKRVLIPASNVCRVVKGPVPLYVTSPPDDPPTDGATTGCTHAKVVYTLNTVFG
jgi:hypothetical protein